MVAPLRDFNRFYRPFMISRPVVPRRKPGGDEIISAGLLFIVRFCGGRRSAVQEIA